MKKYKLIIVARDTVNTGGGHVVEQLCKYLIDDDDFEEIILFTDYENKNITKLGIQQVTTPFGSKLHYYTPKNRFFKIIRHFLQIFIFSFSSLILMRKKYKSYVILNSNNEGFVCDISLTHDVFFMTFLKDIKQKKKKFLRIFNPVLFFKIIKELIVLNKPSTKKIIAISKETLLEVNKICFTNKYKTVIGHGVDTNIFKPPKNKYEVQKKLKNKYNIPIDSYVLLLSGHEYERKGLKYVIEALNMLPDNVILVVTGGGEVEPYRKIAKSLSVENRVYFLGLIDNILDGYYLSDLFVLPTSYEGWGLVATEAMGTGLPVLICNVGGVKDYLIDGVNGLSIERDPKDIAEKILYIKNNPILYERIRENGLKTAIKYNWKNVAKKYKEIIISMKKEKNV